jgi:hypothetical protein
MYVAGRQSVLTKTGQICPSITMSIVAFTMYSLLGITALGFTMLTWSMYIGSGRRVRSNNAEDAVIMWFRKILISLGVSKERTRQILLDIMNLGSALDTNVLHTRVAKALFGIIVAFSLCLGIYTIIVPLFLFVSGMHSIHTRKQYRVLTYNDSITWGPLNKGVLIAYLVLYIITFIPRIVWCLLCIDVLIKIAK